MSRWGWVIIAVVCFGGRACLGDEALNRFEGDVIPYEAGDGWIIGNPCDPPCAESVEDGRFVLRWSEANDLANYHYWIAQPPTPPPPTLWAEWRFRSNHPLGPYFYSCDGRFVVDYGGIHELVWMYGDAAIAFSGSGSVLGMDIDQFHTYRFESLDGINYWISVDGLIFIVSSGNQSNGNHYMQFSGDGGCRSDQFPNMVNEWDYIRHGTISFGEKIIASDPSEGFLDARLHANLDRFTITFDSPNYVYIDDVTVEVTGGDTPVVTQTRRGDSDGPETVEIVLDRPIPMGETTTFTMNDGEVTNIIEYTFAPGDTNGNGHVDLGDVAAFQNCFATTPEQPTCQPLDLNNDDYIDLSDFGELVAIFR